MLLIDGAKYELWTPPSEAEFERVVKEHAQDIFGEQSIYLDMRQKLRSLSGIGSIPDGYAIVLTDRPEWYIVEVELSGHDVFAHVVPQVGRFSAGIKNPPSRKALVDAMYEGIIEERELTNRIKDKVGSEIYKFLTSLISQASQLVIVIDKETEELSEAAEVLKLKTKVIELRTFVSVSDVSRRAYLFEPLYGTPKTREEPSHRLGIGKGKTYPLNTSELLAKYGDRPSNVVGMTWQQLYDSSTDGNFRYFKVRMPLIELDKKETQQEEIV